MIYKTLVGLRADLSKPLDIPEILAKDRESKSGGSLNARVSSGEEDNSEDDSDEETSDDDTDENEGGTKFVNSARPRNETIEDKKARKKAIKDQQAEKRKSKVKKHIKKRREKLPRKK